MMKFSCLFLMLISFAGVVNMPECDRQKSKAPAQEQGKRATPAPTTTPGEKEKTGTMDGEIKELAAGSHCPVFESFVFVARDVHTYQALRILNISLPDQDADFFNSHAVIAAFLGQRRTGGFGVNISQATDGVVQVAERIPKGMVTMVLTTPFKIVAVPVKSDAPIALSLDATWKSRWRNYRLTNGELTITGGFGGVHESSALEGTLQIMRERTLATFTFQLRSTGKRKAQMLDVASGTVTESGQVSLAYLESQALSGAIQSPFKATGQFNSDEQELTLSLETVPSPHISDNFSGGASLRAIAITPRPTNRAITGEQ
jgi:hypothetical protein